MGVSPEDPNLEVKPGETVDQVQEGFRRMHETLQSLTSTVGDLMGRVTSMAGDLSELRARHAVAQVPAAVQDVAGGAAQAGGESIQGAADIAASPAATFVVKRHGFRRVKQ